MAKSTPSNEKKLFSAFLALENVKEMEKFCRDLLTDAEIREFAGRLEVAKKLAAGLTQRQTAKETGVSIATVTRVNKALTSGSGGYQLLIDRLGSCTGEQE